MQKPSNVQIAGGLLLAGGIWSLLVALTLTVSSFCLWVPSYTYSIAAAIVAIVNGAKLLGDCRGRGVPKATAIMQICQVIQGDVIGMIFGIVALVLLGDEETKAYLNGTSTAYAGAGYGYGEASNAQAPYGQTQQGYGGQAQPFGAPQQGYAAPTQQGYGPPQPQAFGSQPPASSYGPPAEGHHPTWGSQTHDGGPHGSAQQPPPNPWGTAPVPGSTVADMGATQGGSPGASRVVSDTTPDGDPDDGFAGRPGTGTAGDALANDAFAAPPPLALEAEAPVATPVEDTSSLDRYRIAPWGTAEDAAEPEKMGGADTVAVAAVTTASSGNDEST